jgi:hypothetical protein
MIINDLIMYQNINHWEHRHHNFHHHEYHHHHYHMTIFITRDKVHGNADFNLRFVSPSRDFVSA